VGVNLGVMPAASSFGCNDALLHLSSSTDIFVNPIESNMYIIQGAVIRELEDELRVQQSPAYRAHAHKAILVTELLRLVQVGGEGNEGRWGEGRGDERLVFGLVCMPTGLMMIMGGCAVRIIPNYTE
jgi:hypothetical protein